MEAAAKGSFLQRVFSDRAPDCVKDVPVFCAKDVGESTGSRAQRDALASALWIGPVVIKDVAFSKDVAKTTSIHKLDLDDFKCVFAGSATRRKQGHAMRTKKELRVSSLLLRHQGKGLPLRSHKVKTVASFVLLILLLWERAWMP